MQWKQLAANGVEIIRLCRWVNTSEIHVFCGIYLCFEWISIVRIYKVLNSVTVIWSQNLHSFELSDRFSFIEVGKIRYILFLFGQCFHHIALFMPSHANGPYSMSHPKFKGIKKVPGLALRGQAWAVTFLQKHIVAIGQVKWSCQSAAEWYSREPLDAATW